MRWLFALFLFSLCALLWAAFAVARHIRRASHRPLDEARIATPSAAPDSEIAAQTTDPVELQRDTR